MKTLLISEVFPPKHGGSGRWFWELYRRMPLDQVIIAAGEHPDHAIFDQTHDLNVVRMPLALSSWGLPSVREIRTYSRLLMSLRRLVKREQVKVVHCGRSLPEGLMGLALRLWTGVPYVCYVHGEELNIALHSREIKWLMHRVFRGARFLIANSGNTRDLLCQKWRVPTDQIHVLYPGVDVEKFAPATLDPNIRTQLKWGNRPVILSVGRLQKRKGHDVMIAAIERIRRTVPDILFAIVGDGEERTVLQGLVEQNHLTAHVQFHGELDEATMIRCYQQCDLFALPNRQVNDDFEGFGIVLLEAQACGKPVIAGASGGTSEAVSDSVTGRVISCDEPAELVAAVLGLLADPQLLAKMGRAGRDLMVNKFDWHVLSHRARQVFSHTNLRRSSKSSRNAKARNMAFMK